MNWLYADDPLTSRVQDYLNTCPRYYRRCRLTFSLINEKLQPSNKLLSRLVISTLWFQSSSVWKLWNLLSPKEIAECYQNTVGNLSREIRQSQEEDESSPADLLIKTTIVATLTRHYNVVSTVYRMYQGLSVRFDDIKHTIQTCRDLIQSTLTRWDSFCYTIRDCLCYQLRMALLHSQSVHLQGGCFLIFK